MSLKYLKIYSIQLYFQGGGNRSFYQHITSCVGYLILKFIKSLINLTVSFNNEPKELPD